MASQVIIMGMIFDEGSVPDFGSIYVVPPLKSGANYKGKNDYRLFEEDVSKLDLITNAAPGSTALCIDTGNIYVLMKSGWYLVGSNANNSSSNSNSISSLNLSPLDLTGRTSLDTTEQTDEPEILENNLFTKPDDLTVEPIKGGEELI